MEDTLFLFGDDDDDDDGDDFVLFCGVVFVKENWEEGEEEIFLLLIFILVPAVSGLLSPRQSIG